MAVLVYRGNMLKSSPFFINFTASPKLTSATAGNPLTKTTIFSNGRRESFAFLDSADTLTLSLSPTNALWARWRYAFMDNVTLTLDNAPLPARTKMDLALKCIKTLANLSGDDPFCDAGAVEVRTWPDGQLSNSSGGVGASTYKLIFDPAERSSLPDELYMRIRRGGYMMRTQLNLMSADSQQASMSLPSDATCLHLQNSVGQTQSPPFHLSICHDDLAHFANVPNSDERTIVIGGTFFRSNYSVFQVDGWAAEVNLQFALGIASTSASSTTLDWVAIVVVFIAVFLVYLRWTTAPETLSVGLYILHANQRRARARRWNVGCRVTGGSFALVLVAVAAVIVGWLSFAWQTVSLTTINFQVLAIGLTVYVGFQVLLNLAMIIVDYNESGGDMVLSDWVTLHSSPLPDVWLRNMLHATGALGAAMLAVLPMALQGGLNGDLVLLFLLLPFVIPLFFTHTYYITGYTAMLSRQTKSAWHLASLVFQHIMWLGMMSIVFYFFLVPFVDTASPFFSAPANFVAAMFLMLFPCVAASFFVAIEVTAALKKQIQISRSSTL